MLFAIVDIETTGGYSEGNRITEIAIIITDGYKIIDRFESLINPGVLIPPFITGLTGIDNSMTDDAPYFNEVAEEIHGYLKDCIFVAHNVSFDFSFVKSELAEAGIELKVKKLCTVRLSRKIFPGFPSYSLGNLCRFLNVEIENRHRAGGDAEATYEVFTKLVASDSEGFIITSLKANSKETTLPPNLDKEQFNSLPSLPGVYYFHDENGKTIYVGKAIDIKKRISGHFSSRNSAEEKLRFFSNIHSISFELAGNELVAFLMESHEIKRLWPPYNKIQKFPEAQFGIFSYYDQNGYQRLSIGKVQKTTPLFSFNYMTDARDFLYAAVRDFDLCPRLSGLQTTKKACVDYSLKACKGACVMEESPEEYNKKVEDALDGMKQEKPTFAIIGKGRSRYENSVVLIEDGKYQGFGFVEDNTLNHIEDFRNVITKQKESKDIQKIINQFVAKQEKGKLKGYKFIPLSSDKIVVEH
jgi:DNA polymerase-3 subunit epsilon